MPEFAGFDGKTLEFLKQLENNNNRAWFAEHKPRYEALVLEPALDFIATMAPRLYKISDHFDALPKRMGGSLMRVYAIPVRCGWGTFLVAPLTQRLRKFYDIYPKQYGHNGQQTCQ